MPGESRLDPTVLGVRPLARALGTTLHYYLKAVGPTLEVWSALPSAPTPRKDVPGLRNFLSVLSADQPLIFATWISDHINLLSLAYVSSDFRELAKSFHYFADDSFGGLTVQSALRWIDAKVLPLSDRDHVRRLKLLRSMLDMKTSAFLAVDGRGPYFQVGTGLVNLARTIGASVVPCSIRANRSITIASKSRVAVPLLGSSITVSFAETIATGRLGCGAPAERVADNIADQLRRLAAR